MITTPVRRLLASSALTCILIGPMSTWVDAESAQEGTLTASIPATSLTHLDLTALDGVVTIRAAANDATDVTVAVTLAPPRLKNMRRPKSADLSTVRLRQDVDHNILRLGLTNAGEGNVEATWTIGVPARFSARISGHDGDVHVNGIAGGVEATLNSGLGGRGARLNVDVPAGKLKLSVGVGDIVANRQSAVFDAADVRASVGRASLFVLGHEIKAPHAPGPGHRITLGGEGDHVVVAKVSVGDVTMRIGEPRRR